jgi:hypothetical protein
VATKQPTWIYGYVVLFGILAAGGIGYAIAGAGDSFHRTLAGMFGGLCTTLVLLLAYVIIKARRGGEDNQ